MRRRTAWLALVLVTSPALSQGQVAIEPFVGGYGGISFDNLAPEPALRSAIVPEAMAIAGVDFRLDVGFLFGAAVTGGYWLRQSQIEGVSSSVEVLGDLEAHVVPIGLDLRFGWDLPFSEAIGFRPWLMAGVAIGIPTANAIRYAPRNNSLMAFTSGAGASTGFANPMVAFRLALAPELITPIGAFFVRAGLDLDLVGTTSATADQVPFSNIAPFDEDRDFAGQSWLRLSVDLGYRFVFGR